MEAPSPQIIEKLHDAIKNSSYQINKDLLTNNDIDTIVHHFNKELEKGNYNLAKYNKHKIDMKFSYKTAYYKNDDITEETILNIRNKITKYIEETIPADSVKVKITYPEDFMDDMCTNCVINTVCVCIPFIFYCLPKTIYRWIDNKRMYVSIEFNTIMPVNIVKIVD